MSGMKFEFLRRYQRYPDVRSSSVLKPEISLS